MVGASLGLMPVWSWVAYSLFFAPLNKASHAVVALFVVQDLSSRTRRCSGQTLRFTPEHGPHTWLRERGERVLQVEDRNWIPQKRPFTNAG